MDPSLTVKNRNVRTSDGYIEQGFADAASFWQALSPEAPLVSPAEHLIYRGQADATWGLEPAVLRKTSPVTLCYGESRVVADQIIGEMKLMSGFVQHCDTMGLRVPGDSRALRSAIDFRNLESEYIREPSAWPRTRIVDLMALAQHHGVPTRLLDWSRRSYVAAYFAASEALILRARSTCPERFAVWVLNTDGMEAIEDPSDSPLAGLMPRNILRYPHIEVVDAPGSVSANLAAQRGLFTLQRENNPGTGHVIARQLEHEFVDLEETPLWKLTVPSSEAFEVLRRCALYGVTGATVYPGYDGAARAAIAGFLEEDWPVEPD